MQLRYKFRPQIMQITQISIDDRGLFLVTKTAENSSKSVLIFVICGITDYWLNVYQLSYNRLYDLVFRISLIRYLAFYLKKHLHL